MNDVKTNYADNLFVVNNRKDCFNASLVDGAFFDGFYDIPTIEQEEIMIPKRLISYERIKNCCYETGDFVHFYIDDYKFDGKAGIWNTLKNGLENKRGFSLDRLKGATGIITPDYSLYLDMPRAMQIWNVYRNRSIGHYLSSTGHYVIPNIRWTDENSYDYAFAGVKKGSIVAVGTHGCSKSRIDRYLFIKGFLEMIKRLEPKHIVIYGAISKMFASILKLYNISYTHFESDVCTYYKEKKYGIKGQ